MGRTMPRSPSFCLHQPMTGVRVRSQAIESRPINAHQALEFVKDHSDHEAVKAGLKRRVMIVVDPSLEAKVALQWALSHTIQNEDILVLLYVTKSSKQGVELKRERTTRGHELLYNAKNICHTRNPEVQVGVALVEGREKGPTIVEEARRQGVSLLVLGQRRRSMVQQLLMLWARCRMNGGMVDYCIKNAHCMTLAVRRNRKLGGYLITTRRHKDFWLLA